MSKLNRKRISLSEKDTYTCPVCRCGEISNITLTEAFGCNVCRHIFTLQLEQQTLKMVDREPPLVWRWTGKTWESDRLGDLEVSWIYWFFAITFVCFPPSLIGLSALIFPPISGSVWSWFPLIWTGLTFFTHLLLILWLIAEAYQFPLLLILKIQWQRIFNQS